MLRHTLHSTLAHKARLALTAVAIVLGVGAVAGTFVLTDTATAALQERLARGTPRADAVIRVLPGRRAADPAEAAAEASVYLDAGALYTPEPVPAALADRVARLDGVAAATGVVTGPAQLVGRDGRVIRGRSTGRSMGPPSARLLSSGRVPAGPGEVALDRLTAEDQGFRVGDRVRVIVGGQEPQAVTVVGVLDAPELPEGVVVGFDPATIARLLGRGGQVDYLEVQAAQGVTQQQLRDRLAAAVGPDYQVLTGQFLTAERAAGERPDDLAAPFLVAAAAALLVGVLVIRNSYTIILASRTRELALLRCVGASRAQLRRSVLAEAAILGAVAALLGVVAGVGLAWAMDVLLRSLKITTGVTGTAPRILPRTVAVALAVGVVTTVASAWAPARRAARVSPMAALREDVLALDRRAGRGRAVLGSLMTLGGIGAVLAGVHAEPANGQLATAGGGALLLGAALLGPVTAPALARLLGRPLRASAGVVGELASGNAARSPRRTAATVLPVMLGVVLICLMATAFSSSREQLTRPVDAAFLADHRLVPVGTAGLQPAMSPQVARRLASLPELAAVAVVQFTDATVAGQDGAVGAADPALLRQAVALSPAVTAGSLDALGPGSVAVARPAAEAHHLSIGSQVAARAATGSPERGGGRLLTVRAIYDHALPNQDDLLVTALLQADYIVTPGDYRRLGGGPAAAEIFTRARAGVTPQAAKAAIQRALADYPNIDVQDRGDLHRLATEGIDVSLRLFYGLFGLAVVVALLGIVNTLALSVLERTRELGLLRAIGIDRRQVRAMIRWEAVIIAGIGTSVGIGIGAFLGWAVVVGESGPAAGPVRLHLAPLALIGAAGLAAGVLAAALPARRAARVHVLRAIAAE